MPKRARDQLLYRSQTNERIGQELRAYYQACMTEELPPRLLAALKKLDEETEPSAGQVEVIRDIES
jgi:anti-sigma factor NepR-like protein